MTISNQETTTERNKMKTLTSGNIETIRKELDRIVEAIVLADGVVWNSSECYQYIDDESHYLLMNYLDDSSELDDQELCNDFYDVRRDAQEALCGKLINQ